MSDKSVLNSCFASHNLPTLLFKIEGDIPGMEQIPEEDKNTVLNVCGLLMGTQKESPPTELQVDDLETNYEVKAYGYVNRISIETMCIIRNAPKVTGVWCSFNEEPSIRGNRIGAIIVSVEKSSKPPELLKKQLSLEQYIQTETFDNQQEHLPEISSIPGQRLGSKRKLHPTEDYGIFGDTRNDHDLPISYKKMKTQIPTRFGTNILD